MKMTNAGNARNVSVSNCPREILCFKRYAKMKNNPNLILVVLLLLVATACSSPESESSRTSAPSLKNSSSPPTPQTLFSNSPVPLKPKSAQSASVISENAALRQSPNGKVLETLPVAASVEVIRQKGAWFYVSYGGTVKGWMHGNTIRFDNSDKSLTETSSTPKSDSKTSTDREYKPAPIERSDSSGASAKCRDGTLSYSRNRRGTCSHHGGVAVWY